MPAAKTYVVLHDFHTRVNDDTGEEKAFKQGDIYDGPAARIPLLLEGFDFHGPLIAEKTATPADKSKEN